MVADREDLPDPVNMMFHHRSCLIHRFAAATEPLDLDVDREEEFKSPNTIKCQEWLGKSISKFTQSQVLMIYLSLLQLR